MSKDDRQILEGPPLWPYSFIPARRGLIEKLCALAPDRAQEFWRKWNVEGFPKEEAERLIAELTEARKPKMHTANGIAERTLRQSAEQLAVKHKEEWPKAGAERGKAIVKFWAGLHGFIEELAREVR